MLRFFSSFTKKCIDHDVNSSPFGEMCRFEMTVSQRDLCRFKGGTVLGARREEKCGYSVNTSSPESLFLTVINNVR